MRLTENLKLQVPEAFDTLEDSLPMLQFNFDTIDTQLSQVAEGQEKLLLPLIEITKRLTSLESLLIEKGVISSGG